MNILLTFFRVAIVSIIILQSLPAIAQPNKPDTSEEQTKAKVKAFINEVVSKLPPTADWDQMRTNINKPEEAKELYRWATRICILLEEGVSEEKIVVGNLDSIAGKEGAWAILRAARSQICPTKEK